MGLGCIEVAIILIIIGVPAAIIALFVVGARANTRKQEADDLARRVRGERITELLDGLKIDFDNPDDQRELYRLLHEPAVGYMPELTERGGWFERVVQVLGKLARTESGARVVAAYFRCFVFPSGQQAKALEFVAQLLRESGADVQRLVLFTSVATAVLALSSHQEARWLYDQVLATVRLQHGHPAVKTAALAVGRLTYSAGRSDRQPTIYDEQAIANDIAAQIQ